MMTVPRTICLGFLALILVGTGLLTLPISLQGGQWGDVLTALFTSTSAVCVTGLVVVDTGTYFSGFGQFCVLLLIQLGGLGYMTATTILLLVLGRRFGLRDKVALQQTLDIEELSGAVQLVKSIVALTLLIELIGAIAMFSVFSQTYGTGRSLWLAVFHSISAFNNAGFGLFPDSLISYATSVPINLIITALVILGGIGYQVMMEVFFWGRDRLKGKPNRTCFSLNFKVATSTTLTLLLLGFVGFLGAEFRNPDTLGQLDAPAKFLVSWFMSVTPRTAGFNTIDYGRMTTTGLFITIALMFVGASPGSTGGGMKTTTLRVLFECTRAVLRGKEEVLCYRRQIPNTLLIKAIGVVFGSVMTVILATVLITLADPDVDFTQILFESVSAFATVGLSTGITAQVSTVSKLVLILTMYIGRVGVLMLMLALLGDRKPSTINYPQENLLVG
jgi:trk system potassium uptake protein TrkH